MKARVLIAEDHQLLRRGLCSMIDGMAGFTVVGEAGDGKTAIREAIALLPDLVVMDVAMPGMTGIEATAQIKQRLPATRVLVLSICQSDEFVREALRAGADGYLLKGASYDEFVLALNTLVEGKRFICQEISMLMMNLYLHPETVRAPQGAWQKLSVRERSILKLVAEGHTNRATGEFLCISTKTVEKHRASLMRKLGLRNTAELVLTAIDLGLVEHPELKRGAGHKELLELMPVSDARFADRSRPVLRKARAPDTARVDV